MRKIKTIDDITKDGNTITVKRMLEDLSLIHISEPTRP